jgi:hypothetical protein
MCWICSLIFGQILVILDMKFELIMAVYLSIAKFVICKTYKHCVLGFNFIRSIFVRFGFIPPGYCVIYALAIARIEKINL